MRSLALQMRNLGLSGIAFLLATTFAFAGTGVQGLPPGHCISPYASAN